MTGGAGFVGSHLVDRLLAEGHELDAVDDLSGGSLANLADARARGALHFHQLDCAGTDIDVLCARRRPEVVYHLAGLPPGDGWDDPVAAAAGIAGSLRVVEAARRAGAAKVVVVAGARLYGPVERRDQPVKENRPLAPDDPAGTAEAAVIALLRLERERHGLEHTVIVLADAYGPRQRPGPHAPVAGWLGQAVDGTALVPADRRLDLVYVDDAVDALARAATRGGGLTLHVGTGTATPPEEVWDAIEAGVGRPLRRPARRALTGAGHPVLDARRASIHLGWRPWTEPAAGIAATATWAVGVSGTGPPPAS